MKKQKNKTKEKEDTYYIAPEVKKMLLASKNQVVNHDWDRVFLVDGNEGSGKSVFGLQLGKYLDPTLSLDRIVFTGDDFSEAINKAEKNQCIIFDEAFNGLNSSGAMTKMNRMIVRKLQECRQKNLFIIVILPTIFMLQKYAAIFRSHALFHVYATKAGTRGYYKIYNKQNKKILYLLGKQMYSYSKPFMKKSYRFYGKYPLDEEEYRKKKLEALQKEDIQTFGKIETKYVIRFACLCKLLKEKYKMDYKDISKHLIDNKIPTNPDKISLSLNKLREFIDNRVREY